MSKDRKAAPTEEVEKLHKELTSTLSGALAAMDRKEPNAALLNVVRQFVKDNGITSDLRKSADGKTLLNETLPEFEDDDSDLGDRRLH